MYNTNSTTMNNGPCPDTDTTEFILVPTKDFQQMYEDMVNMSDMIDYLIERCIGFEKKDSVFHDGKFPMLQGDQIQTDIVNLVPFYREYPQVQQALTDLQKLMEERFQSKEKTLSELPHLSKDTQRSLCSR